MEENKDVTIYDIAEKLNLATSTISRALKDHPTISSKTIKIREIKGSIVDGVSSMAAHKIPCPGVYADDKVVLKRVRANNYVTLDDNQYANPWNGKPVYCSWYA